MDFKIYQIFRSYFIQILQHTFNFFVIQKNLDQVFYIFIKGSPRWMFWPWHSVPEYFTQKIEITPKRLGIGIHNINKSRLINKFYIYI
jgi:hypothetical protein